MGIVDELQASAESDDVLTVLRKAKRVASKLNRQDIADWLDHEQNGYPSGSDVPAYRLISCEFAYNTNGPVPVGGGMAVDGIKSIGDLGLREKARLPDSIGAVVSMIENLSSPKGGLYVEVDESAATTLRSMFDTNMPEYVERFTFFRKLNSAQVRDIPNQIKNAVLDWALKLEAAGINGEGHSFSPNEKQVAQTVTYIYDHSTNKITGTLQGAFQIGSAHATQNATVTTNSTVGEALSKIDEAVAASPELDDVDKGEIRSAVSLIRDLAAQRPSEKAKLKINEKLSAIVSAISITTTLSPHVAIFIQIIRQAFA